VIPHVELPRHRLSGEERSAFARGSKERKLRIVVDRATVPEDEALELLLGLGHHPWIELLSTRAEGFAHLDIGPIDQHKDKAPAVIRRPDGSRTHTAVWPPHTAEAFAERYLRDHPDLGDTDEILRVLLLASASRDRGADALVTASPVLVDPALRGPVARDGNAMPVEPALALAGLYLRARDDFTLRRLPGFRETLGRGLFYWVLARELLPNAWRSTSAGVQHKQATGDDRVLQLFMSAITRLDRALRSRDRLHHQMKLEQNNDTADEALFFLDTFLVFLVAAFDAVGRAAHLTYGLDASRLHEVSWRRPWRTRQLAPVAASLAQLMDDGTAARDALDLVALLRNTVHGEALRTVAAKYDSRPVQNALLLPEDQELQLLASIARRGGNEAWGIRELPGRGISMQMDVLVESIFPMTANALDTLIGGVEVERLAGVQLTTLPTGPPVDDPGNEHDDVFDSIRRRQVRLMAGL
jgi:hypothetical protein